MQRLVASTNAALHNLNLKTHRRLQHHKHHRRSLLLLHSGGINVDLDLPFGGGDSCGTCFPLAPVDTSSWEACSCGVSCRAQVSDNIPGAWYGDCIC